MTAPLATVGTLALYAATFLVFLVVGISVGGLVALALWRCVWLPLLQWNERRDQRARGQERCEFCGRGGPRA